MGRIYQRYRSRGYCKNIKNARKQGVLSRDEEVFSGRVSGVIGYNIDVNDGGVYWGYFGFSDFGFKGRV